MSNTQEALALHTAGRTTEALILLFNAIGAAPSQSPAMAEERLLLASLLDGVALNSGNAVVFHVLLELLRDPQVDPQSIARAVLGLLAVHGAFQALEKGQENIPALQALFGEPLVRELLRRVIVTDARAERVFAFARRLLIENSWVNDPEPWQRDAMLTVAMAAEHGEYAWPDTLDIEALLSSWVELIAEWLDNRNRDSADFHAAMLLRLCMFRPLSIVPGAERLLDIPPEWWGSEWHETLQPLLDAQLSEPLAQHGRGASLPTLTNGATAPPERAGSDAVRAMYETHPYPRWSTVAKPHVTTVAAFVQAITGGSAVPDTRRVLIAGCGTGRQTAHTALSFPDADILALDLSRASLGYAARKAEQLGLGNVQFMQGDLLQLDSLQERFALIFCSGVLHHLANPAAGWRQLVQRLHPAGVIKVALYSSLARQPVSAARAVIAAEQFAPTDEGIRACRQHLLALPANHAAKPVTESADFFSASGCRDLLMHVQERSYTLAEIEQDLALHNLRFLGFQLPAPVRAAFTAMFPNAGAANDLEAWARFEERHPTTFWGMYQFFVAHRQR